MGADTPNPKIFLGSMLLRSFLAQNFGGKKEGLSQEELAKLSTLCLLRLIDPGCKETLSELGKSLVPNFDLGDLVSFSKLREPAGVVMQKAAALLSERPVPKKGLRFAILPTGSANTLPQEEFLRLASSAAAAFKLAAKLCGGKTLKELTENPAVNKELAAEAKELALKDDSLDLNFLQEHARTPWCLILFDERDLPCFAGLIIFQKDFLSGLFAFLAKGKLFAKLAKAKFVQGDLKGSTSFLLYDLYRQGSFYSSLRIFGAPDDDDPALALTLIVLCALTLGCEQIAKSGAEQNDCTLFDLKEVIAGLSFEVIKEDAEGGIAEPCLRLLPYPDDKQQELANLLAAALNIRLPAEPVGLAYLGQAFNLEGNLLKAVIASPAAPAAREDLLKIPALAPAGDENSGEKPAAVANKPQPGKKKELNKDPKPDQSREPEPASEPKRAPDEQPRKKGRGRRRVVRDITYAPLSFVQVGHELLTKLCIKLKLRPLGPQSADFALLIGDLKQALYAYQDFEPRFEHYPLLCQALEKLLEEYSCDLEKDGPHKLLWQLCLFLELALKKRGIDCQARGLQAFLKTLGLIRLKNGLYVTVAGSYGLDGTTFVKNDDRLLNALCEECGFPPLPQLMGVVQVQKYFALQTLIPMQESPAPDEFEVSQDLSLYEEEAQGKAKKKRRSARSKVQEEQPQTAGEEQNPSESAPEPETEALMQDNQESAPESDINEVAENDSSQDSAEALADAASDLGEGPMAEPAPDAEDRQEDEPVDEAPAAAQDSTELEQADLVEESAADQKVQDPPAAEVLEEAEAAQVALPETEQDVPASESNAGDASDSAEPEQADLVEEPAADFGDPEAPSQEEASTPEASAEDDLAQEQAEQPEEPELKPEVQDQPAAPELEEAEEKEESLPEPEQAAQTSESAPDDASDSAGIEQADLVEEPAAEPDVQEQSAAAELEETKAAQDASPVLEQDAEPLPWEPETAQTLDQGTVEEAGDKPAADEALTAKSLDEQDSPYVLAESLFKPEPSEQDGTDNGSSQAQEDLKADQATTSETEPKSPAGNEVRAPKRGRKKRKERPLQLDLFEQFEE